MSEIEELMKKYALDVPCDSIDMHDRLCYSLLHVKHGSLATINIPIRALEIIKDVQEPLRKKIEYLEERLKEYEY